MICKIALRVPVPVFSIAIDAVGAFTFVRMADTLGEPRLPILSFLLPSCNDREDSRHLTRTGFSICSGRVAASAGAVFGTITFAWLSLIGCCIVGKKRTIHSYQFEGGTTSTLTGYSSCCGSRTTVTGYADRYYQDGYTRGREHIDTSGYIYHWGQGIGLVWNAGSDIGGLGWFTSGSNDQTTSRMSGNSTTLRPV